ncbi:hypothetical protein ACJ73_05382 [Blastomyces percursus]|uniref:Uncharacterized protein n=1 Tax=Blastomyces percursus TaxID=1658174 RepID=A0A1J9Q586_9EURO|nr:hypothetical protein ACJ73_05382 [Blastomyces percursus]
MTDGPSPGFNFQTGLSPPPLSIPSYRRWLSSPPLISKADYHAMGKLGWDFVILSKSGLRHVERLYLGKMAVSPTGRFGRLPVYYGDEPRIW